MVRLDEFTLVTEKSPLYALQYSHFDCKLLVTDELVIQDVPLAQRVQAFPPQDDSVRYDLSFIILRYDKTEIGLISCEIYRKIMWVLLTDGFIQTDGFLNSFKLPYFGFFSLNPCQQSHEMFL